MKTEISIIIPAYLEKVNLTVLIPRIYQILKNSNFEVIVVDDDSNDGTEETVSKLSEKYDNLKIIVRKKHPRDLSKSCQLGFESAKYSNILVMDGDLQHDPIYIPMMLNEFQKNKCDIVVGARDLLAHKVAGLSFVRHSASKVLIKIIDLILNRRTADPMSGYFLFKKEIYSKNKNFLYLKGYKILADLIYSNNQKLEIRDIKIEFRHRIEGESKMNFKVLFLLLAFIFNKLFKKFLFSLTDSLKKNESK